MYFFEQLNHDQFENHTVPFKEFSFISSLIKPLDTPSKQKY